MMQPNSTIVALSTPPGAGAIGVIRLSGQDAVAIVEAVFKGRKKLHDAASHTLHFGRIIAEAPDSGFQAPNGEVIDEVVVSLFRAPHSYTGEDVVEISCHGSPYILQRVVEMCIGGGAIPASAGEFTTARLPQRQDGPDAG